jgi:hypothetical protein
MAFRPEAIFHEEHDEDVLVDDHARGRVGEDSGLNSNPSHRGLPS